jgi:hypothetical protein
MRARPLPVIIAVVLLALLSLANLLSPLFPLKGVGPFGIYLSVVLGVLGFIGAAGLWSLKRWSVWLTITVCVLNFVWAAPGLGFAGYPVAANGALAGDIGSALIILLVVLPNSLRAYT